MALIGKNFVFLHLPKTAGMWIRQLFKNLNIETYELGTQHMHFPDLYQYESHKFFESKFIFTFIRHPKSWYQSRWSFRMKNGWQLTHPLDYNCASNDFNQFVKNAIRYKPDGWFSNECKSYLNAPHMDFVGKYENLEDDINNILTQLGFKYDNKLLRNIGKLNDSTIAGRDSSSFAIYEPKVEKQLLIVENYIISRYYPNDQY